jgi:hypothetical protein
MCELSHNAQTVSQRMWNFFTEIIGSIMADKGVLDEYLPTSFVILCNVMKKDP